MIKKLLNYCRPFAIIRKSGLVLFFLTSLVIATLSPITKSPFSHNIAHAAFNSDNNGFFFGTNIHNDLITSPELDAILVGSQDLHMTMTRGGMSFADIAPTSSDTATWNWTKEDEWITKTTAKNIIPLVNIAYSAPWLPGNYLIQSETTANKNAMILGIGNYAYEVANRYKPGNANNLPVVNYYNVWNEPSLPQFFIWGPDDFARLVTEVSYRIKQANPNAQVGFNVHAVDYMYNYNLTLENQTGSTYVPRVLSKTVTLQYNGQQVSTIDYLDLMLTDSYPDRSGPDIPEDMFGQHKEMNSAFTDLNAYLTHTYGTTVGQRYGYGPVRGKKRYIIAESGWYACPSGLTPGNYVTEQKQAALIVRSMINVASNPLTEGYLQFDIRDDAQGTDCINTNFESENFYGLARYTLINGALNPKLSYTAYKTTVETLDNTNSLSKQITTIDTNHKIFHYKFASTDGTKTVSAFVRADATKPLGVLDTTASSVTIPVTVPQVTRININGTTQILSAVNNSITLSVTENPFFILYSADPTVTAPPTPTDGPTPTNTPIPTPTSPPASDAYTKPRVQIFTLSDGQQVPSTDTQVTIYATSGSINGNITGMKIFVNHAIVKDCPNTNQCSGLWKYGTLADGYYIVTVQATDASGVVGQKDLGIFKGAHSTKPHILYPNNGERWTQGSTHTIRWEYLPLAGAPTTNLSTFIYIKKMTFGSNGEVIGEALVDTIPTVTNQGNNSVSYTVPTTIAYSGDYRLIMTVDTGNGLGFDYSDGDFAIAPTAPTYSISGALFNDYNNNGIGELGEDRYAGGATVQINGTQSGSTVSDSNGVYTFANLEAGDYSVSVTPPNLYQVTTSNPYAIYIGPSTNIYFGLYSPTAPTLTPTPTLTPMPTLPSGNPITINWNGVSDGQIITTSIINLQVTTVSTLGYTKNIRILIDGVQKAACMYNTQACSYSWNTATLAVGTHTLYTDVFDQAGYSNNSTITVTKPAPTPTGSVTPILGNVTVQNVSQTEGQHLTGSGGNVTITANTTTGSINGIKIFIDGVQLKYCNITTQQCSGWWNWGSLASGSTHIIRGEAYDTTGHFGFVETTVVK